MVTCPYCGRAMVYRFNSNWSRSQHSAEYVWVRVTDPSHIVEDNTRIRAAS